MATFNTVGLDEVEAMITRSGERAEKAVEPMLKAGGEVIVEAQRKELGRKSLTKRSTGTLQRSIGMTGIKINTNKMSKYVDIYPQGEHPHGYPRKGQRGNVSSAQVGFVLEYGRSNMPARPWMSKANRKARQAVHDAQVKVWEAVQNGG